MWIAWTKNSAKKNKVDTSIVFNTSLSFFSADMLNCVYLKLVLNRVLSVASVLYMYVC